MGQVSVPEFGGVAEKVGQPLEISSAQPTAKIDTRPLDEMAGVAQSIADTERKEMHNAVLNDYKASVGRLRNKIDMEVAQLKLQNAGAASQVAEERWKTGIAQLRKEKIHNIDQTRDADAYDTVAKSEVDNSVNTHTTTELYNFKVKASADFIDGEAARAASLQTPEELVAHAGKMKALAMEHSLITGEDEVQLSSAATAKSFDAWATTRIDMGDAEGVKAALKTLTESGQITPDDALKLNKQYDGAIDQTEIDQTVENARKASPDTRVQADLINKSNLTAGQKQAAIQQMLVQDDQDTKTKMASATNVYQTALEQNGGNKNGMVAMLRRRYAKEIKDNPWIMTLAMQQDASYNAYTSNAIHRGVAESNLNSELAAISRRSPTENTSLNNLGKDLDYYLDNPDAKIDKDTLNGNIAALQALRNPRDPKTGEALPPRIGQMEYEAMTKKIVALMTPNATRSAAVTAAQQAATVATEKSTFEQDLTAALGVERSKPGGTTAVDADGKPVVIISAGESVRQSEAATIAARYALAYHQRVTNKSLPQDAGAIGKWSEGKKEELRKEYIARMNFLEKKSKSFSDEKKDPISFSARIAEASAAGLPADVQQKRHAAINDYKGYDTKQMASVTKDDEAAKATFNLGVLLASASNRSVTKTAPAIVNPRFPRVENVSTVEEGKTTVDPVDFGQQLLTAREARDEKHMIAILLQLNMSDEQRQLVAQRILGSRSNKASEILQDVKARIQEEKDNSILERLIQGR